jgi:HPt (histidine-containing phosphotransfer) domain-containing protein
MTKSIKYLCLKQALKSVSNDLELLHEVLEIYLDELPIKMELIEASVKMEDHSQIISRTHALKGVSANIGVIQIKEICEEMENCPCHAKQWLPLLKDTASKTKDKITEFLNSDYFTD